ncbi:MAG: hypothetical protein AAF329_24200 [Cyanobacteria bacterium P01_A01_bin.17]
MLDTETVAGFLPLTCPRDIHHLGMEFLTEEGGKPLYMDLFSGTGWVLIISWGKVVAPLPKLQMLEQIV